MQLVDIKKTTVSGPRQVSRGCNTDGRLLNRAKEEHIWRRKCRKRSIAIVLVSFLTMTTISALAQTVSYYPLVADGRDWKTTATIENPNQVAVTATIEFLNNLAESLEIGTLGGVSQNCGTGCFRFQLAPGERFSGDTPGGTPGGPELLTGYTKVTASSAALVSLVVTLFDRIRSSLPPATNLRSNYNFSFTESSTTSNGITIVNPAGSTNLQVTLFDDSQPPNQIAVVNEPLGAGNRLAVLLGNFFAAAIPPSGSVSVASSSPVFLWRMTVDPVSLETTFFPWKGHFPRFLSHSRERWSPEGLNLTFLCWAQTLFLLPPFDGTEQFVRRSC